MKRKFFVALILPLIILIAIPAGLLAEVVRNKEYLTHWSSEWVIDGTDGMWKGFYIRRSENVLKTDLIEGGGGEWKIPGDTNASIWEGLNIVQPSDNSDLGYIFTALRAGKVEFQIIGKLDQPTATDIEISVYKNGFADKIFPEGPTDLLVKKGIETTINFVQQLNEGDKIFFKFHSPVEIADTPQFRFTAFSAVYRSFAQASSSIASSQSQQSSSSGSNASSSGAGSSEAQVSEGPSTDSSSDGSSLSVSSSGIIIDDDTSFPLKSKYEDLTIDDKALTVSLKKSLTLKDLMESFTYKNGYTIAVFNKDASPVKDEAAIITSNMVIRVYNYGTPVSVLKIIAPAALVSSTSEQNDGKPLPGYLLPVVVGVILAGILATVVLVVRKKKA